MADIARNILMVAFGVGTLLDFFIAIVGMSIILRAGSALAYLISVVMSIAVVCISLCMAMIFSRDGFLYQCLKGAFWAAVGLSLFATLSALTWNVFLDKPLFSTGTLNWDEVLTPGSSFLKLILLLIAVYLVSSPVVLSHLVHDHAAELEAEEDEESSKARLKKDTPPVAK